MWRVGVEGGKECESVRGAIGGGVGGGCGMHGVRLTFSIVPIARCMSFFACVFHASLSW